MSPFRLTRQTFLRTAAAAATAFAIGFWPLGGRPGDLAAEEPARVGDPLPPEIEKAWGARQKRWNRMFCEISGYTVVGKELLAGIPGSDPLPVDQVRNVRRALWIDLETPRLRIESRPGDFDHGWNVLLYDGNTFRAEDRHGKPVDLRRYERTLFEYGHWPILFGHGMVGGPEGWLSPASLRRAYDRRNYEVAAVRGSFVSLRSKPFSGDLFVVEYDVDPAREGLVVGSRFFSGRGEPRLPQGEPRLPQGELQITEVREGMPVKWTHRSKGWNEFLQIDRRELDPDFSRVRFRFDAE